VSKVEENQVEKNIFVKYKIFSIKENPKAMKIPYKTSSFKVLSEKIDEFKK
jgi:hypothetical protein